VDEDFLTNLDKMFDDVPHTAQVLALRVSRTRQQTWMLYGPIDQALKTTIQSRAVKAIPFHVTLHKKKIDLELWIDADQEENHHIHGPATIIVERAKLDQEGVTEPMSMVITDNPIRGRTAVVTGAGGTNVMSSTRNMECLMEALFGQHDDDHD